MHKQDPPLKLRAAPAPTLYVIKIDKNNDQ
jgi:hypothetical protein